MKAALGVFWFFMTYVVRVVVNLSLEPTFNPIKHFPVVTVSHNHRRRQPTDVRLPPTV